MFESLKLGFVQGQVTPASTKGEPDFWKRPLKADVKVKRISLEDLLRGKGGDHDDIPCRGKVKPCNHGQRMGNSSPASRDTPSPSAVQQRASQPQKMPSPHRSDLAAMSSQLHKRRRMMSCWLAPVEQVEVRSVAYTGRRHPEKGPRVFGLGLAVICETCSSTPRRITNLTRQPGT